MTSRSIHVVANGKILFFFMSEEYYIVYVCTTFYVSIHLLMDA